MGGADVVEAVAFGQIGHQFHLFGADVAGNATIGLQADIDDGIARRLVRHGLPLDPPRESRIGKVDLFRQSGFEGRRRKIGGNPVVLGRGEVRLQRQEMLEFLFHLAAEFFLAQFVDQDLHALLVDVVAPGMAVPHPQDRLDVGEDLVGRQEVADAIGDEGRAAHAAAGIDFEPDLARVILDDAQGAIVPAQRRPVRLRSDHRDLELARQIAEFGVERRHLADGFRPWAGVHDLVGRGAGVMVRRDVADAFAAGLDRVHFHGRQLGQDVGRLLQLDPVVLDVLAGGEMAVSPVIGARDMGQLAHLARIERAIGDGDAQHVGVELEIEPVLQPQGLELVVRHLAGDAAAGLVAEFLHAGIDHRLVVLVVSIHQITQLPASGSAGLRVRSGRTVGPSARIRSLI